MAARRRTESEPVRRRQLLAAARKVFREKGYNGATISDIVREAGVAQGTFYLYYSSKNAVAISLLDGLMERMAVAVGSAMKSDTSFDKKLGSMIGASFRVARQNADLFALAFIGADETHPEMHSESPEHDSLLRMVTDLFTEAVGSGEMESTDPKIAARLAIGLLQHAIIEAFVSGDGESEGSEQLEQGVRVLLVNALVRRS